MEFEWWSVSWGVHKLMHVGHPRTGAIPTGWKVVRFDVHQWYAVHDGGRQVQFTNMDEAKEFAEVTYVLQEASHG